MSYNIEIGSYRLKHVESVKITRSVENLMDTATIVTPATVFNKALEVQEKLKASSPVKIQLGYDDNLKTEFEGYLKSVKTDGGSLTLECEDALYLFKGSVKNAEYKNITVKTLLQKIVLELESGNKELRDRHITINCQFDFSYEKFTTVNASGLEVLKKIHDEAKPNIFLKDNVLHIQPLYFDMGLPTIAYNMAVNIDRDGMNLKYRRADERKLKVTAKGKNSAGKEISVTIGEPNGDTETINFPGVTTEAQLKELAQTAHDGKVYEGYEGDFTAWLVPYIEPGYSVMLKDDDDEVKNGKYYVLKVDTTFDSSGGKRIIGLGKKL
ncbi:MAG: hypothetical protein IKI25_07835 [Bacteroidales bacterium]|nr:hypothetical protein [Bacteroidales bacterium]